ncbi:hypothetical protein D3C76_469040 [compost metagenome]
MSKDNGGAAFPLAAGQDQQFTPGMSLRDHFAAKTIESLISSGRVTLYCGDRVKARELAELSYQVADALISARSK